MQDLDKCCTWNEYLNVYQTEKHSIPDLRSRTLITSPFDRAERERAYNPVTQSYIKPELV